MRRVSRDGVRAVADSERVRPHCGCVLCSYNPTGECWQRGRWEADPEERAEIDELRVLLDGAR